MLRESAVISNADVELDGLTDPSRTGATGVPHAELLIRFADAVVARDDTEVSAARQAFVRELGAEYMVDAAGVVSIFQRLVRIADGIGIPLDDAMQVMSADVRAKLGINDYVAAANTTELGGLRKLFLTFVGIPMFRKVVRRMSSAAPD